MNRILYAEDDPHYQKLIQNYLAKEGYDTVLAQDGLEAIDILCEDPDFDCILLDIMMPRLDGKEAAKEIRSFSRIPIIMLTALDDESDEITGFDLGADDYITKPFSYPIFMARVKAVLRRSQQRVEEVLENSGLHVDLQQRKVFLEDQELELTQKEFALLVYLLRNNNLALSREAILDGVWGFNYEGEWRNVDTHIKRLRKRLGKSGEHIKTIYGYGYRWESA